MSRPQILPRVYRAARPFPSGRPSAAAGPTASTRSRGRRAAVEALDARRLLAAPEVLPLPFPAIVPQGEAILLPVRADDADGDAVTFGYEVTSANAADAMIMGLPADSPFLEVTIAPGAPNLPQGGTMTFALFDLIAPETVRRIGALADSGFYDGQRIARVENDFVIQFGSENTRNADPADDLQSGALPEFTFDDEFDPIALFHGDGQLAMANAGKDTNGSQVFITEGPQSTSLDGRHTLFGQLVRGFDVRDALSEVATTNVGGFQSPSQEIAISSVRVVDGPTDSTFLFIGDSLGTYDIEVTATDANGEVGTRTYAADVVADAFDSPPVLFELEPFLATDVNQPLVINADVEDPEGDDATIEATLTGDTGGGVIIDQANDTITYLPGQDFVGEAQIDVRILQILDANPFQPGNQSVFDSQTILVAVGDDPAVGTPVTFDALAGAPATNLRVASFTDPDPSGTIGDWAAIIDWGDGAVSDATIVPAAGGGFDVLGDHQYARAADLPVLVTVVGDNGARTQILSEANVTQAAVLDVANREIDVTGSPGDDAITITSAGGVITVTVNGVATDFDAGDVDEVDFTAGAGDDDIDLSTAGLPVDLNAGPGNDTVLGSALDDTLLGGDGNDLLDGGAGDNLLDGGLGNDGLRASGGSDTLRGGGGDDTLEGFGNVTGPVLFEGQAGNDTIVAFTTGDTLDGGTGDDNLSVINPATRVVDGATFLAGDGNDTVAASVGNDSIAAGSGNDSVLADDGNDTVLGGAGNDTLNGGADANALSGGDGDDTLFVLGDADTVDGDAGQDVLDADLAPAGATLRGGAGNDTVTGSAFRDTVDGGADDDQLDGGAGSDTVEGGAGNDYVMGGTGFAFTDAQADAGGFDADSILGGDGDDTLSGGLDANFLDGGPGNDLLNGSGSRDTLLGGEGNDVLRGWGNDDTLDGGAGDDTLEGDALDGPRGGPAIGGADSLVGGTGSDVLRGLFANDTLSGGNGADLLFGGDGDADEDLDGDLLDTLDSVEVTP